MSLFLELIIVFFCIGLFTFGGGYCMIQMMQEVLVAKGWLSLKEVVDFIAISEATPGTFAINVATFVGMKLGGFWYGLAGTLGMILPSIIIISIISKCYQKFKESNVIKSILLGIRPVVIGLIIGVAITIAKSAFLDSTTEKFAININAIMISLTILCIKLKYKKISPIILIIIGAILGIFAL